MRHQSRTRRRRVFKPKMNRNRWGFVNDIEHPVGPHVESKRVARGRPRGGNRAAKTGRDRTVNMARKYTNDLRVLLKEFGELQPSTQ